MERQFFKETCFFLNFNQSFSGQNDSSRWCPIAVVFDASSIDTRNIVSTIQTCIHIVCSNGPAASENMIKFEKKFMDQRPKVYPWFFYIRIFRNRTESDGKGHFSHCSMISVNVCRISTGEWGECKGHSIFGAKNVNSGLFEKFASTTDMHQAEANTHRYK